MITLLCHVLVQSKNLYEFNGEMNYLGEEFYSEVCGMIYLDGFLLIYYLEVRLFTQNLN